MSKHYLTIGEHGLYGDFFICNEQLELGSFRADNLTIATKIAFNQYLKNFNNFNHECELISLADGTFTVRTDEGTENYTVSYHGPSNMYGITYKHSNASNDYKILYAKIFEMAESGDDRFRISKKSGLVMFNCSFPRWRKNGEWWSQEHTYLDPDDLALCTEMFEYALSDVQNRIRINTENYNTMCTRNKVVSEVASWM